MKITRILTEDLVMAMIFGTSAEDSEVLLSTLSDAIAAFHRYQTGWMVPKIIHCAAWDGFIPFSVETLALDLNHRISVFYNSDQEI